MIEINSLTKTFDDFVALNNLNLNIKKGSIYGLIGINGAGKTTAIKHLAGIYLQDKGTILFEGEPLYDNAAVKERVGFIPDDLYFFPNYSMEALRKFYRNLYKNWSDERYEKLTKLFNLEPKRKVRNFSKGMQKQAAFVFAMSIMPDFLLLDEPIDGLDPIVRKVLMREVMEDVASRELAVLVSSHNLKEMEGICDSIGIMKKGSMILESDIDDLKSDIHKIQVAFSNDILVGSKKFGKLDVLHLESRGSVELLVVKGKESDVIDQINALSPLLYDILPLTLEEIFTYETEDKLDEIPY